MISTIPQIIENSAKIYPDKLAYKYFNQSVTYTELLRKSKTLATVLLEREVQKGDRVGIYMNRSLETAIAIYGIAIAGCAYVPLDPTAPKERIRHLIEDCDIKHLVTVPSQKRNIKILNPEATILNTIIGLNDDEEVETISWNEVFEKSTSDVVFPKISGEDLAYIMYTSGSTGVPKGIMHTHNSCLAYAKLSKELYDINSNDIVVGHAPLHFDISTFACFTAPLAASTIVILSDAHTKMPASLSQLMEKEKISIWYSAPQALIQLLSKGLLAEKDLSSMRWVLFGGEVFPVKYLKQLVELWPQAKFSNVYGPAEVNQCTYFNIDSTYPITKELPLGKVWNNTQYRIIDENNKEVLDDEPGELAIRSDTMMLGYWNNPELTQKSLYKVSILPNHNYLFFKTGDVVRRNEEGNLVFVGRNDRQIKVRGYRVELDEIETQLNSHENVIEASVFAMEREDTGNSIIAVALLNNGEDDFEKVLQIHCAKTLPKYAVPEHIYMMEEFPRTTTDKIDRNKIKELILK